LREKANFGVDKWRFRFLNLEGEFRGRRGDLG
jgi:hypothetical protein